MTDIKLYARKPYQAVHRLKRTESSYPKRGINVLLGFLLLISLSIWVYLKFAPGPLLPIKNIKVEGHYTHVDREALKKAIVSVANHDFLWVDTAGLEERLLQIPWVAEASVTRNWPGTLVIHLAEPTAVARWGQGRLLSDSGMVFNGNSTDSYHDLPLLNAPEGQQQMAWEGFQRMSEVFSSLGLKVVRVDFDARHSWTIQLSNGMWVILGRANVLAKLKHFVAAYGKIVGSRGSDVNYVDLRYSNGLAVRWKS